MTALEDCFAEGKLQPVPPSDEKAQASLRAARENLTESRLAIETGLVRAATNSMYIAVFDAARAILFRDGIRGKSHFCLEQYLLTYVQFRSA